MLDREIAVATEAVRLSCDLCSAIQDTLVTAETMAKKDRSPVTIADFGSQAIVNYVVSREFPDVPIVAEEDAGDLRLPENEELKNRVVSQVQQVIEEMDDDAVLESIDKGDYEGGNSGRFWTLDPIDGTKGYLRGEQYAIALALIEDGEVVLGVLGCPNLPGESVTAPLNDGIIFAAVKAEGAKCSAISVDSWSPVTVSPVTSLAEAAFCESVEAAHTSHGAAARIAEKLGVTAPPVRIDSQCKYAVVARGEACIYMRLPTRPGYEEKIWDHAAGCIITTEAGGRVTDTTGAALDFSLGRTLSANKGVIGTNGTLHDQVITSVQSVLE